MMFYININQIQRISQDRVKTSIIIISIILDIREI